MIRICSLKCVTLRAISRQRALAATALVVMLGSLSACSMGTEVGNGVKPSDQSPSTSPNPGQGPKDTMGAPSSPDSSAPTTASNAAGVDKTKAPGMTGAVAAASTVAITLPTDTLGVLDVAFASCASPLAKDVANTTTYSVATSSEAAKTFVVMKDADAKSWDILDTNTTLWRKILPSATNTNSTFGVTATDTKGTAVGLGYQCSTVATTTQVTLAGQTDLVTKRTVTLTQTATGRTKQLVWYIAAVTNAATITVPRVELTDIATGVVTVFAAQ